MPPLPKYEYTGPVDCTIPPDRAQLKGKSVIVTGGTSLHLPETAIVELTSSRSQWNGRINRPGIRCRRVCTAPTRISKPSTNKTRAFVTIADVNDERGNNLAKELHPYGTQTREAIQD